MDNAAKALLIAGGIFLSIIVISIFLMMYNRTTEMAHQQQEVQNAEEISKYNEKFLAYYKRAMYGSDVLSALHLAISNNEKYDVSFGEEYFVDITFQYKNGVKALSSEGYYTDFLGVGVTTYSIGSDISTIKSNILPYAGVLGTVKYGNI